MTVTLKSMRYFLCALKHGSIAKAAEELNIAASAVSVAIDQIEAHFELRLVNRQRSRGIEPTTSGRAMARKFNALIDEYDAVLAEGAELKQGLTGNLRIGYYAPVAPAFMPRILNSLLPRGDGVTLDLREDDNDAVQEGLLNGQFDAILFVSNAAHPRVEFDVLIDAPAYCLLPSQHARARQKSIRMSEIAEEPVIKLNRPLVSDYYRSLFDETKRAHRVVAYANSTEMVRSLVGAGHGCAILNMFPETGVSYAGDRLVGLPIEDDLPPLTLAVGYDKSNPRRIVRRFVDGCLDYFNDETSTRCIVTQA